MLNVGYLTAHENDEQYTPESAVYPIIKHAKKFKKIWCPFDKWDSSFVKVLSENGFEIIHSHIDEGKDFLSWQPDDFDCIISNPPFSSKDAILKRLSEIGKPFAILLPLPSLQGQKRFEYLKDCQALVFDKRINFFSDPDKKIIKKGVSFATIYVCKDFLPKDLIFERLED